jgi:deferrochelatase/peroxidase EfeB
MLYARQGKVVEWANSTIEKLPEAGFSLLKRLDTAVVDGFEPFGFRDNISQPQPDWNLERKAGGKAQLAYTNLVSLGEFLLGYPNEYGQFTNRPVIDAQVGQSTPLLPALDQPGKLDLGRNGTYLVLRQLEQDVHAFWQFLDKQANADSTVRDALAQAMVGRTREGVPLVAAADPSTPQTTPASNDANLNDFSFDLDSAGVRCPLGAHIRRSNPRNADFPAGTHGLISRLLRMLGFFPKSFHADAIASARFHRLLRRGRKYGTNVTPQQAIVEQRGDGEEHGIYFICLNANIVRQFEFVQNAWIMGTKFDGLTEENDPLIGNRLSIGRESPADSYTLPQPERAPRRLTGIPQFVTVRGGAYFFLPSIRVLQFLTKSNGHMQS